MYVSILSIFFFLHRGPHQLITGTVPQWKSLGRDIQCGLEMDFKQEDSCRCSSSRILFAVTACGSSALELTLHSKLAHLQRCLTQSTDNPAASGDHSSAIFLSSAISLQCLVLNFPQGKNETFWRKCLTSKVPLWHWLQSRREQFCFINTPNGTSTATSLGKCESSPVGILFLCLLRAQPPLKECSFPVPTWEFQLSGAVWPIRTKVSLMIKCVWPGLLRPWRWGDCVVCIVSYTD